MAEDAAKRSHDDLMAMCLDSLVMFSDMMHDAGGSRIRHSAAKVQLWI